mgnify:CR=1 FL=1
MYYTLQLQVNLFKMFIEYRETDLSKMHEYGRDNPIKANK